MLCPDITFFQSQDTPVRLPALATPILIHLPAPTFFIDIDGVLYGGSAPVAEGPSVIEFLRQQGSGFLLVTNTTRMSQQEIQQKLTGLGYRVQDNEIYPVSLAAVDYINTRYGAARCFMIGDASLETLFAERGHTVVRTEEPVAAVIMGLTLWPHFGEIDIARRLVDAGAEPVALHADPTWPDEGITRIGLGSMVAALEVVISRPITLIGKPQPHFFTAALERAGFVRENTIMIGDSLNSDIAGATAAGLKSLLVRTGNSAAEPLPTSCDWELPSIAELPGWYQTQFGS